MERIQICEAVDILTLPVLGLTIWEKLPRSDFHSCGQHQSAKAHSASAERQAEHCQGESQARRAELEKAGLAVSEPSEPSGARAAS